MKPQTAVDRINDVTMWRNLGRSLAERLPMLRERDRRLCGASGCTTFAIHEKDEIGYCIEHWMQLECVRT